MTEERIKQKKESEMLLSLKESDEINDSKSNTIKMRRTKEELLWKDQIMIKLRVLQ